MPKFSVYISLPSGGEVMVEVVEASDWNEAIEGVLEKFKTSARAVDSQSWDVSVRQVK